MPGNSGVLGSEGKKNLQANQAKNAPEPPPPPLAHWKKCFIKKNSAGVSLCIQLQDRSSDDDFRDERGVSMPSLNFLQQCDL